MRPPHALAVPDVHEPARRRRHQIEQNGRPPLLERLHLLPQLPLAPQPRDDRRVGGLRGGLLKGAPAPPSRVVIKLPRYDYDEIIDALEGEEDDAADSGGEDYELVG